MLLCCSVFCLLQKFTVGTVTHHCKVCCPARPVQLQHAHDARSCMRTELLAFGFSARVIFTLYMISEAARRAIQDGACDRDYPSKTIRRHRFCVPAGLNVWRPQNRLPTCAQVNNSTCACVALHKRAAKMFVPTIVSWVASFLPWLQVLAVWSLCHVAATFAADPSVMHLLDISSGNCLETGIAGASGGLTLQQGCNVPNDNQALPQWLCTTSIQGHACILPLPSKVNPSARAAESSHYSNSEAALYMWACQTTGCS